MANVWLADVTANRLNATYITDFLDISGGNLNIRTPCNLVTNTGSVNFNRNTTLLQPYTNDVSLNGRLFVGGDVSMGDISLNINGNLSIAGTLSVGAYKTSSISLSAIASAGGGSGGGYTTNTNDTTFTVDMSYNNKMQMNNDVSLNANIFSPTLFTNDAKVTDLPRNWTDIEISNTGQYQIAVVGGNQTYFVATGGTIAVRPMTGNVWISTDYGNTWTEKVVGGGPQQWVSAMVSGDGSTMMAKGVSNCLYRSTDAGLNWNQIQFTFTDVSANSATSIPGANMKMAVNGNDLVTYCLKSIVNLVSNYYSCRVITSSNGGISWTDISNNNDGRIQTVSASRNGQYIIVLYSDASKPVYSADYGQSFIRLTNGPVSDGNRANGIYDNGASISNNGKVCIGYYASTSPALYTCDVTSGIVSNGANNVTFTTIQRPANGLIWGVYSSPDGKYIMAYGRMESFPAKSGYVFASTNYGATFFSASYKPVMTYDLIFNNFSNFMYRAWSARFSADNVYMVAVKEMEYIYVRKPASITNPYQTTLSNATTLKVNGNITFSDGSTINSYNNNLDFSVNITPSLTSIAANGYTTDQYPVGVSYDGKYIVFPNTSAAATSLSVSTNYGISVATRTTPAQCTNVGISGNGKIIIADCGGLYRSTDIGVSLTAILPAVTMGSTVISLSYTGQYGIIVSQGTGIIYVTNDYGLSWSNSGLTLTTTGSVRGVVSGNGKYMYAVGSAVGYISSNYGASFTSSPANSYGSMRQLSISYTGQYMARQDDGGNTYYYSGDYGATWASVTNGGTWGNCMSSDGKYRFALHNSTTLYCSSDYGSTWQSLGQLTASSGIIYITCTSNGQNLYIRDAESIKRFTIPFKTSTFTSMTVIGSFASNPQLSASDYRIKTNVQTLDETDVLDKLRPVTYYQTQLARNDIGFIAHELQEHYPDLVEGEKDGDKMQSVNYNGILALLINEVQRLKQDIKETKAVIAAKKAAA